MSASTPPCFALPARLAWRNTSPVRSTPGLLRAPYGGGGQVLVEPGLEADIGRFEMALGPHELLVEAAERRAAIAGDVPRGIEPGAAVALLLHQAEADQRLESGDKDAALA